MLLLGIETTCDETGAAVVKDGREIYSNVLASQAGIHKRYGGVVPEIAARKHLEALPIVVEMALEEAGIDINEIDAIAVASDVGLPPALVTGYSYASGLALGQNIPLIKVNHLEAHAHANFLYERGKKPAKGWSAPGGKKENRNKESVYPHICLLASGGHTELLLVTSPNKYKVLGQTKDDAAGEAFDKVARMLGLGYPGGAEIDKLAAHGDEKAFDFPRPMMKSENLDFSFSGLKTAVLYKLKEEKSSLTTALKDINEKNKENISKEMKDNLTNDIAASFQEAVVDVLVYKAIMAANTLGVEMITLGGGVAANSRLREVMTRKVSELGYELSYPETVLCMDNGAMIAGRGYYTINPKSRSRTKS
ncbi:MAG TPA: tRNA (adenosine(37)-N6)-threonylcarbamoyltransferase complex transferase subunit TsaD [bacterium]|nr:tRNA (adenosine(37)-N6)-threonylcarbamoyltransferase complex transferase subunit TsaD [bacterium]